MRQFADTLVVVDQVDAGTTVLTRVRHAVVDVCFAVYTRVTGETLTAVVVQVVNAGTSVLAGVGTTLVDVRFTPFAAVPW